MVKVEEDDEDVVVDENTFANRATPPELKTEKAFDIDVADSSSDSDDSVRNHIRSKL